MAIVFLFVLAGCASGSRGGSCCGGSLRYVLLETEKGDIKVELDENRAPLSTQNFLKYVSHGLYNNAVFHRTVTASNQPQNNVKIEVIQGGPLESTEKQWFAPVKLERTNVTGLRHHDGTISLARDGPDTATSNFFICIGEQPELDYGGKRNPDGQGFAAFGRVAQGMDVVRMIQNAPADGQKLAPPIKINRAVEVR
jgi:peptidyl-prolyl cis-trans isomerase A (cyclophilin A)